MYSVGYLEDIRECQGDLYEEVADKGQDVVLFSNMYLNCDIRRFIDEGYPKMMTMLGEELYEECGAEKIPKLPEKFDPWAARWIGEFYAMIQWHTQLTSKEICKKYPIEEIIPRYNVLHDLDIEVAVERWIGRKVNYVWNA